jgi:hypothetical protein
LIGPITQLIGPITQLIGSITQLIGAITQLIGSITQLIGPITQLIRSITQLIRVITQLIRSITQLVRMSTIVVSAIGQPAAARSQRKRDLGWPAFFTVCLNRLRSNPRIRPCATGDQTKSTISSPRSGATRLLRANCKSGLTLKPSNSATLQPCNQATKQPTTAPR